MADAGIDNLPLAHRAGIRIAHDFSGLRIASNEIQGRANHFFPRCRDDGICLRVNGTAQFIYMTQAEYDASDEEDEAEEDSEV